MKIFDLSDRNHLEIQLQKWIVELEKANEALRIEILELEQEKHKINRHNSVLEGINRIFGSIVKDETEEELGNKCLSIALEVTGSQIGFIGEVGADGLLYDTAISDMGWNRCVMYDKTGHRRPPGDLLLYGLHGYVVNSGQGLFTNNPQLDPHSIGLPKGHPPLTSFLGVPLVLDEKIMGILAVANRENGYSLEQQEDLEAFAPAVMQALQRKREEKEKQKAEETLREGEEKYKALFENSLDAILFAFPEGTIYAANPAACQMFGMTEEEIISSGRNGIIDTSDPRLTPALEERARTGRFKGEFNYRRKDGTIFQGDMSSTIFKDKRGILRAVIIIRDITKRKQVEDSLRKAHSTLEEKVKERTEELENAYNFLKESEKCLAEAQEIAHLGSWDWDIVTNKVCWSDETYRIFGLNPQELEATFDLYFSHVHPDDRDSIYNAVKKALNGESYSIDYRIILPGGERTVHSYGKVIFNEENTPIRMSGTTQDITDRKKTEEMLKESKSKLKTLFELLPVGVSIVDRERNILDANLALENIVGLSKSDLFKGKHATRIYVKPDGTEMSAKEFPSVRALREKGSIQNSEIGIIKEDGSTIWTDVSATAIPYYNDQIVIITRDITERKMAEESMTRIEIARKQEIHHRIKNNLQVISSLLDLQAEKFGNREFVMNSEVMEAFRESQDRVVSMALIHEKLHKSEELDTLNFSLYIEELAENLFQTYRLGNSNISLNLDLEENIFFDMDYAVPLGIIINELVSNSLKYAFPGKNEGEIRIELHREENEEYEKEGCKNTSFTLTVSDNGVGVPENLDIEEIDSLGFQLVTSLVEQLDGEFELERNKGTKFNIRFTVTENNNQSLTLQE